MESIADIDSDNNEYIYSLYFNGSSWYIQKTNITPVTKTTINVSSYGLPTTGQTTKFYSSTLFATQAANFVVFSCSALNKLIYYNVTTSTAGAVSLPANVYPKRLITHANRIFLIDTKNTLWWSKAGTFVNATDWYGTAPSGSSVIEDSGYWVIEKERYLAGLVLLSNNLYIFGGQNIYIFSGYDYDTFALQIAIADLGVQSQYNIRHGWQTGKAVYFMSVYQPAGGNWLGNETLYDIYEFNGSAYPTIINRQVIESGQVTNGMLGSIDIGKINATHICADEMYVYVYKEANSASDDTTVYVYDIKYRTWWKRSGFNQLHANIGTSFSVRYIPAQNRNTSYAVVYDTDGNSFYNFNDIGVKGTKTPYGVTKAFSSLPTDKETLTAVIVQLEATAGTDLSWKLYISNSADQDDFRLVKENDHYIASGTIDNIEVYLPVCCVPNVRQYRLKLEISGGACKLYNIERRFRVRGRSR